MTAASIHPSPQTSAPTSRYLIGVLYYGAIDREHQQCVEALARDPRILGVFDLQGCPYIDQGRSLIATRVLDTPEIDGLLFIDHDMIFDVAEALKVIDAADACQGVAGAAYSMRRPGRIIGEVDGKKLAPDQKIVFFEGGESLPASYLGMGMTAIHRSVFERLVHASQKKHERQQALVRELRTLLGQAFPPSNGYETAQGERLAGLQAVSLFEELTQQLANPDLPRLGTGLNDAPVVPFFSHLQRIMEMADPTMEGTYFGEDVSFCVRCHEAEVPVQVETRARVFHKGAYHYGIEDVGMQVPYCDRLEVVAPKASADGAPAGGEREPKPAFFSTNPDVQEALEARFGAAAIQHHPRGATPSDAPPEPELERFPKSYDPLSARESNGASEARP
jgi:hypothetical protein